MQSQQIVMYSHYFYKPMIYNPAFTGSQSTPNVMLLNHTQWSGFKGAPQYNVLTFDRNLKNTNTGLGISVLSDRKGVQSKVGANLSYSYKLRFQKNVYLLLGLSAGAVNQSINYTKANIEDVNDPYLFSNNQNKTSFDASAGIAFFCKNFVVGFSAPQLADNTIKYSSINHKNVVYKQNRHYLGSMTYKILLSSKKDISLAPLCLVRYLPNTPIQYDANLNLDVKNKFWIGGTYKNNYAIGLNLGVVLFKQFSIGYSYDYITGSINKYAGLSHEILLNFKFAEKKEAPTVSQEELNSLSYQELNKLMIDRLLKKIDAFLDKDVVTPQETQNLLNEIEAFLDSEAPDPIQETLNKYYRSLKNQAKGEINVLIKGQIVFEDGNKDSNYSNITITIIDEETHKITAVCKPSLKDGKYYAVLKPGKKYSVIAENKGYQRYTRELIMAGSKESYEMNTEIKFKK